jgi:uncharacterized membrane protein
VKEGIRLSLHRLLKARLIRWTGIIAGCLAVIYVVTSLLIAENSSNPAGAE